MVNARWPNAQLANEVAPWRWSRAVDGCKGTLHGSTFTTNTDEHPEAVRLMKWGAEAEPYVHGYWEWDWGDAYAPVTKVQRRGATVSLSYATAPLCKKGARWMGVNLLCELDSPREFYIDVANQRVLFARPPFLTSPSPAPHLPIISPSSAPNKPLIIPPSPHWPQVYFFPPSVPSVDGPAVVLMYQPGGVLNVTSAAQDVRITNMSVVNGRHAGILAAGASGLRIDAMSIHAHGTHGIVATGVAGGTGARIADSEVYDVGCSGIRATAGEADALVAGGLTVADNHVHHVAQWKRSYMPAIYWGGVQNTFARNVVEHHPHACFVGGGDFEDGVDNVFEENTLHNCVYETLDAGGFYSSGQSGTAFTNRGNVLRGNTFTKILDHAAGTGVQQASVQAVYLDDQQSGWSVIGNTFSDCHICTFIGGGRRNRIEGNRFVRCGTAQYFNDQGITDPSINGVGMVNCSEVLAPFQTVCSTGAATWMTTQGPAAAAWARRWPEMTTIMEDSPGYPAFNAIVNNSYCRNLSAPVHEFVSGNVDPSCPDFGPGCQRVLASWKVEVRDNRETHDC